MEKLRGGMLCMPTMHTGTINTEASRLEAARVTELQNTSEYLSKEFFGENDRILSKTEPSPGSELSLMIPTAPYAEGGVMVIARGEHSYDGEEVSTEFIQNYDHETQKAYYGVIYHALNGFRSITPEEEAERYRIFASENAMVTVTSATARTSRSIAHPHAHIMRFDMSHIEPCERELPHLRNEQAILNRDPLVARFTAALQHRMTEANEETLNQLSVRTEAPFGYTFVPSLSNDFDEVARVMSAHHKAYTANAEAILENLRPENQVRIIPQPSYRQYFTVENGQFTVTVSPEFISHAGAIEAAGVFLERHVDHPHKLTPEEKQLGYDAIMHEIEKAQTTTFSSASEKVVFETAK